MTPSNLSSLQSAWSSSSSSSSPSSPPAAFPIDLDAEEVAVLSAPADPTETYNDRRSAGEEGGGGGGGEEGAGGGRGRKKSRKKVRLGYLSPTEIKTGQRFPPDPL